MNQVYPVAQSHINDHLYYCEQGSRHPDLPGEGVGVVRGIPAGSRVLCQGQPQSHTGHKHSAQVLGEGGYH